MKTAALIAPWRLAWHYTVRHPALSLLLAAALGLVLALPFALRQVVDAAEREMRTRAASTPLVMGQRGSALDLVLTALHFRRPVPPPMTLADVRQVAATARARVVPLYIRFEARHAPIVGTEIDYFIQRQLTIHYGTLFTRLGDAVLGSAVAARLGLGPGDSLISTPEQSFDLAGVYPLKMRITGVLQPSGTDDDEAVFVDLKTCWLIEGLAHGHEDLAQASDDQILQKEADGTIIANASVRLYNEVTPANVEGFHFHGGTEAMPVNAALIWPADAKADAMLSGRYLRADSPVQLVAPAEQIESLLQTLFRLERLLLAVLIVTTLAALTVAALVFGLSFRLRRRQFATLEDIGISRPSLVWVKIAEVILILLLATTFATGGLLITRQLSSQIVKIGLR